MTSIDSLPPATREVGHYLGDHGGQAPTSSVAHHAKSLSIDARGLATALRELNATSAGGTVTLPAVDARRWVQYAEGFREAFDVAAQAERQRCKAITTSEHARGRPTLALHLATATDLSVEEAAATLRASPIEDRQGAMMAAPASTLAAPAALTAAAIFAARRDQSTRP